MTLTNRFMNLGVEILLTNAPRGTKDILPSQVESWLWLEDKIRELCKLYGYEEIRTPTFEHT